MVDFVYIYEVYYSYTSVQFPLCYTSRVPVGIIFPLSMPRARSVLNGLIWWVKLIIILWVGVRIRDRVRVTVRDIVTVRGRFSKKLGSG